MRARSPRSAWSARWSRRRWSARQPTLLTLGVPRRRPSSARRRSRSSASWRWLPVDRLHPRRRRSSRAGSPPTRTPSRRLVVLAGSGWCTAIAAAGDEVRVAARRPSAVVARCSCVANAAFLVWGGFVLLSGDLAPWRGHVRRSLAAVAHLASAAGSSRARASSTCSATSSPATGVGPRHASRRSSSWARPVVPVAWAAEAVALDLARRPPPASAGRRGCARRSRVLAMALHLAFVEYPISSAGRSTRGPHDAPPAPDALVDARRPCSSRSALAAAARPASAGPVARSLAGAGVLLVAWAIPFEAERRRP